MDLPRRRSTLRPSFQQLYRRKNSEVLSRVKPHLSNGRKIRGYSDAAFDQDTYGILTYGIEVISVSDRDTHRQMRVAYNSVFRRIFNYRPWQSVSELQMFLSRPTWEFERKFQNNCLFDFTILEKKIFRHVYMYMSG